MLFTCSVWVCGGVCEVLTLCSCWRPQQLLKWSAVKSSSGCIQVLLRFWYFWLNIIISNAAEWADMALLSTHDKESVCAQMELNEPVTSEKLWIFGRIFHTSYFPLCYRMQSPFIWQENQTYCTTTHPDRHIINFQKWNRVRSQRHSFKVCISIEVYNIETW